MFLVSKRKGKRMKKRGGVSEENGKRRELTRGRKRLNLTTHVTIQNGRTN